MHTDAAWKERVRVDSIFRLADDIPLDATEVRSHFARYITVLVSGYIEVAVTEILSDFAARTSNARITNYVRNQLGWFQNPNAEKLRDLISVFDSDWRKQLDDFITEEREAAMTSVYGIRNKVAHGRSTDITIRRIREYAGKIFEVVELLDEVCYRSH